MVRTIARERRKRELEPALEVLARCREGSSHLKGERAAVFTKQIDALAEITSLGNTVLKKVSESERSRIFPLIMRFLK